MVSNQSLKKIAQSSKIESESLVHSGWKKPNDPASDRRDAIRRNSLPIETSGGTPGKTVSVHNVNWDGKELVSLVVMNAHGRRIPNGLTYRDALELASRLIFAAKILQENTKAGDRA